MINKMTNETSKNRKFKIRIDAKLRNSGLINAREALDLTRKEVAKAINIGEVTYGQIELMHIYPNEEVQLKIYKFYKDHGISLNPLDLFPEELKNTKLRRRYTFEKSIAPKNLLRLNTLDQKLLPEYTDTIEKKLEGEDLQTTLDFTLSTLKPIEEDVIRMYFGLYPYKKSHTEDEISKKYNYTPGGISAIKVTAIKRLRSRVRSKYLREFLGKYLGEEPLEQP